MAWEKKPPIHGTIHGCLHNPVYDVAPMDMEIAVGFGYAIVTKDGEKVYEERIADIAKLPYWTVQDAENEALKDPDHDWRIELYAPLYGRTFQRHEKRKWVLIEENQGFA